MAVSIKDSLGGASTVSVSGTVVALNAAQQLPWSYLSGSGPFRVVGPANSDYPALTNGQNIPSGGVYIANSGSAGGIGTALNNCMVAGFSARIAPGLWDLEVPVNMGTINNARPTIVGSSFLDTELRPMPIYGTNGAPAIGLFGLGHFSMARLEDLRINANFINNNPAPATLTSSNVSGLYSTINTSGSISYFTASVTGGSITAVTYSTSFGTPMWGSVGGSTISILSNLLQEGFPLQPGDNLSVAFTGTLSATSQFANQPLDFTTDAWRNGSESSSALLLSRVVVLNTSGSIGPIIAGRPCSATFDGNEDMVTRAARQLSVGFWCHRMYNGTATLSDSVLYGLMLCGLQYRVRDTTTLGGGMYLSRGCPNSAQSYLLDGWFDNGVDGVYTTNPFTDAASQGHTVNFVSPRLSGGTAGLNNTSGDIGGSGVGSGVYFMNGQLAYGGLSTVTPLLFASSPALLQGFVSLANNNHYSVSALLGNVTSGQLGVQVGTNAPVLYSFPEGIVANSLGTAYGTPYMAGQDNRALITGADSSPTTITVSAATASPLYLVSNRVWAKAYTSGSANYVLSWNESGTGVQTATITCSGPVHTFVNGSYLIRTTASSTITGQVTGSFVGTMNVECVVLRVG